MALKGGTGAQKIDLLEVMISGMASASTLLAMALCRSSTVGATPTALAAPNSDGPEDPATAALAAAPVSYVAATTGPIASNATTDSKLQLGTNAFGGIVRWNAAPTQQWGILGNTASLGECVLMNSSAGGGANAAANVHFIYEPY